MPMARYCTEKEKTAKQREKIRARKIKLVASNKQGNTNLSLVFYPWRMPDELATENRKTHLSRADVE